MPVVVLKASISLMTSEAVLIEQKTYIDRYPAPVVKGKEYNTNLGKQSKPQ